MNHDDARRLMSQATEGHLDEAGERDLALHLVTCPECKAMYEGLRQTEPILASVETPQPPEWAVEATVMRATTVLRGEADGAQGLVEDRQEHLDFVPVLLLGGHGPGIRHDRDVAGGSGHQMCSA
jgi:hypothetical protein